MEGWGLVSNFLDPIEATALLQKIDEEPWDNTLARRVQHYGYRYVYKMRQVAEPLGPIPSWLLPLCGKMQEVGFGKTAEQVIVNEYQPGQGIGAHIDSAAFGPIIASLSLGSSVTMCFQNGSLHRELHLPARSLLVLSGPARWGWMHSIPARRTDPGYGPRERRVSLTFRTLAP